MPESKEIEVRKPALPALADTPAVAPIDANDISLPKLYKGEYQSSLVQEELVPAGSIFLATGADDPDPQVIVKNATTAAEEGVLVHVLSITKRRSMQDENGELQSWAFNDPDAHPDARTTYGYVLALPEVDPDLPVKTTLAKTSTGCAKRINFHLLKHGGPPHELAFRLKLKAAKSEKGGQKYRWFVWQEKLVEADPKNVEIADTLARLVATVSTADIERSDNVQPAI